MPTKKVILELEFDSDFESSTYSAVGDLLTFIEDSDFTIKGVKVEDAYVLKLDSIPNIKREGLGDVVTRKFHNNTRY